MTQQAPQKRGVNWIMLGSILIAVLIYFNYDPVADFLGRKTGMYIVNGLLGLAIIFSPDIDRFLRNRRS